MASVFKPVGSSKYVIVYTDENGRRRKKAGATDKAVSERIARDLENRVALRREGVIDARAEALVTHEARPLADHLADWRRDMLARGKTSKHADQYHERAGKLAAVVRGVRLADLEPGRKRGDLSRAARRLADVLTAARLSELAPDRIQAALARLREAGKSNQTVNHYRAALRAFARWCDDNGRLRDNPMRGVKGFNPEEDLRHERRTLTDDELARLILTAENGPEVWGMPGPLRAMAYRTAAGTGFRAEELRSLAPEAFRLDGPEPSVFLRASATKNRRPAEQPVPFDLARHLATWLRDKPPGVSVFPLHHETAKAIRADLEAAGIPYETNEGVADFHSLRGYYVGALVRAGASISEVRALARHAKPETTLRHYARVSVNDMRGVVESLPAPRLPGPAPEALAATGTDPAPSATGNVTKADANDSNLDTPQHLTANVLGFAKPLDWETGLGGSNPPLSAFEPTEADRTRPSPSFVGVSGVSCFRGGDMALRQHPPRTDSTRPPRATKSATSPTPLDDDLAVIIDAWPHLPEPIRAGILAMVKAASGQGGGR